MHTQINDSIQSWERLDHVDCDIVCTELAIKQDVTYKFRVIIDCGKSGSSLPGLASDEFRVKRNRRQIVTIIEQSKIISPGKPNSLSDCNQRCFFMKKRKTIESTNLVTTEQRLPKTRLYSGAAKPINCAFYD